MAIQPFSEFFSSVMKARSDRKMDRITDIPRDVSSYGNATIMGAAAHTGDISGVFVSGLEEARSMISFAMGDSMEHAEAIGVVM